MNHDSWIVSLCSARWVSSQVVVASPLRRLLNLYCHIVNSAGLHGISILNKIETIYWTCSGVANMAIIIIVRLNLLFLGSHNSQKVTLLESQISWEVTFQKKITFPGESNLLKYQLSPVNHISQEVTFPEKLFSGSSHFPLKLIFFRKFTSSRKVKLSREIISLNFTFIIKSHFPEIHIFPWNSFFPGY